MKILNSIRSARHRIAMAREFDAAYYRDANPDASGSTGALLKHYLSTGWRLGRDPSPNFSTVQYLVANPDVADAGVNPLLHYVLHGKSEGRAPKPEAVGAEGIPDRLADYFCDDYYCNELGDLPLLGLQPLDHYLLIGWNLGFAPSATFDGDLYLSANPDAVMERANPLLHWVTRGKSEGRLPVAPGGGDDPYRLALQEGLFDAEFYKNTYEDAPAEEFASLRHYKLYGWWQYRNPSASFDAIWYHHTYMAETAAPMDPLLHYMLHGRKHGYRTKPGKPSSIKATGGEFPSGGKRICLFAGYDADGLVDDAVLTYIEELSKYADVYYLADSTMEAEELSKLSRATSGAWARRHGGYDFGSWSILARDLVGWDVIETYDELLLVNDSAFLVRPLESVFNRMDHENCAWWGLQATKGIAATFERQGLKQDEDLSHSARKEELLDLFEDDPIYDFLIGSYFLALRKPIIRDQAFRNIFDHIRPEYDKSITIRKYEIGIGRWFISKGYQFRVLVEDLYTDQPVYSERAFSLIEGGFPLFKRFLLTENHYDVSYLNCWRERLERAGATADFGAIWQSTLRHSDHSRLVENLHRGTRPNGEPLLEPPLLPHEIGSYDRSAPKFDHWWVFPVCAFTHSLDDNTRAVFEAVKMNPNIAKIILTRGKDIEADGVNVRIARIDSRLGQYYMARARHVFIKHTVRSNVGDAWDADERNFYNLWHGIPLKRIGYTSLDRKASLADTARQNRKLKAVICASDVDRLAMASAHYPLTYHDMWKTGLPRHDFILMGAEDLPHDLREQEDRLLEKCEGKKLVLFVPTFRNDQAAGYYAFSEDEIRRLSRWLEENNAVLGIREHMADTARQYSSQLAGPHFIDLSARRFRDVEILYRRADILITDYSSCYIDFSLTGRPVISFAFDAEAYEGTERGFFYDLSWAFPGPVVRSFDALVTAMSEAAAHPHPDETYFFKRKIYCNYVDTDNTARVLRRVLESGRSTRVPQIALKRDDESGNVLCVSAPEDREGSPADTIQAIIQAEGMTAQWVGPDQIGRGDLRDCAAVVIVNMTASDDVLDLCELAAIHDIPTLYVEMCEAIDAADDLPRMSARKVRDAERAVVRTACGSGHALPAISPGGRAPGPERDLYTMLDRISALDLRYDADVHDPAG